MYSCSLLHWSRKYEKSRDTAGESLSLLISSEGGEPFSEGNFPDFLESPRQNQSSLKETIRESNSSKSFVAVGVDSILSSPRQESS